MSALIQKHQPFLNRLAHTGDCKERRKLINRASSEQLKTIPSLVYNILTGKLDLSEKNSESKKVRNHICANRLKFRKFINSCCSPTKHRRGRIHIKPKGVEYLRNQLAQQRGGFFPLLIPLLALAGKAALAGAVSAGTGLVVKKIAGY